VAIEVRLEQIECESPRFCIMRNGRSLVDEPMGHGEACRRAAAIGRELGISAVEVARTGERITLYAPPAAPGLTQAGADGALTPWPAGSLMEKSPAAG
jgi:hypothetical protein